MQTVASNIKQSPQDEFNIAHSASLSSRTMGDQRHLTSILKNQTSAPKNFAKILMLLLIFPYIWVKPIYDRNKSGIYISPCSPIPFLSELQYYVPCSIQCILHGYIYRGVKTYTCLTRLANKKDILDRKRLEHENDYPSHIMKSPQTRCRQDVKRVGFGIP